MIHGRDYVDKVTYDRHDPYYLLCLIMILRCDQHKVEFILYAHYVLLLNRSGK